MRDSDLDLPDLVTGTELAKARKRQRLVGRLEGGVAVAGVATLFAMFSNWIPWLFIISIGALVVYRVLSKKKKKTSED